MTLDEAIKHAEEVADKKEREKQKWEKLLEIDCNYRAIITEKVSCELCAEEHKQLARWLTNYKQLGRNIKEITEIMQNDADAETKCKMISNILTAKPHYFELAHDKFNPITSEEMQECKDIVKKYTPKQEIRHCRDCKWWKDSDGVYRRGAGAESQCPMNRKEVYEGNGYCYMFKLQEKNKEWVNFAEDLIPIIDKTESESEE